MLRYVLDTAITIQKKNENKLSTLNPYKYII